MDAGKCWNVSINNAHYWATNGRTAFVWLKVLHQALIYVFWHLTIYSRFNCRDILLSNKRVAITVKIANVMVCILVNPYFNRIAIVDIKRV